MRKCHILLLLSLALLPMSCGKSTDNDYFKPVPGSYILADTADLDKPNYILQDVEKMRRLHPEFAGKILSNGVYPPTSYYFKFKGRCDQEKALVAAVRVEIRRSTRALIVCTDTPPEPEPGLPPNLPDK